MPLPQPGGGVARIRGNTSADCRLQAHSSALLQSPPWLRPSSSRDGTGAPTRTFTAMVGMAPTSRTGMARLLACSSRVQTWSVVVVLASMSAATAMPTRASGMPSCVSHNSENTAILHIPGGELASLPNLSAEACAAACCRRSGVAGGCVAWTAEKQNAVLGPTGMCYLKNATIATIATRIEPLSSFTAGCLPAPCPIPPSPPTPPPAPTPPPLPPTLVRPRLSLVHTIASLPKTRLRDPTTALFDPVSRTWHLWASHKPDWASRVYTTNVTIRHFVLRSAVLNTTGLWEDAGTALNASGVPGRFDANAVYTPGAAVECATNGTGTARNCTWYLWFGGVPDQGPSKHESIGVAMAASPWGPFVKYDGNPVFATGDANSRWCGPVGAARVDEIKPLALLSIRYLAVKCVCSNFTALPVFYSPVNQNSWGPPYKPSSQLGYTGELQSPMVSSLATCAHQGFEEPTFFVGPDGFLHFLGHNHGQCAGAAGGRNHGRSRVLAASQEEYQHLFRPIGEGKATPMGPTPVWRDGGLFTAEPGHPWFEPNPVPRDGSGVFGDRPETGVPEFWVDFGQWNAWLSNISLMRVTWVNASSEWI